MRTPNKLAAELAGALIVVSLLGTSAFAESRHREVTQSGGQSSDQQQGRVHRDSGQTYNNGGESRSSRFNRDSQPSQNEGRQRGWDRGATQVQPQTQAPQQFRERGNDRQRYDRSTAPSQQYDRRDSQSNREYDRGRRDDGDRSRADRERNDRGDNRGYDNRGNRGYDNHGNRGYDNRGNRGYDNRGYDRGSRGYGHYSYPSRDGRAGAMWEGRISRLEHERGGYRVWLDRGGYSYWVPEARFRLWPLRVGLSIRFGGWWNPLGYYDVYDAGPIDGPFYTTGDLHGIVENVDYARGTVVLRDDVSGSFVTALLRGNDPRLGDLRPGDYVDLSGAWTRNGYFDAYNVQDLRDGGYSYRDRY